MKRYKVISWVVLISMVILSGCDSGERTWDVPSSLKNAVSFSPPERWQVMKEEDTSEMKRILYYIPYPPADGTKHSANATLIVRHAPKDVYVQDLDVMDYHVGHTGYIVVSDSMDGENWRTVLGEAHDEVPYVLMERFGIDKGIFVHFTVGMPLMNEGGIKWKSRVIQEFNEIVRTLRITDVTIGTRDNK